MALVPKRWQDSASETSQVVLPHESNPLGYILGGTVMHMIDITGALACHRHTNSLALTGGSGYDFLSIDDRNIAANIDENLFFSTHVSRVRYPDQINPGVSYTVNHAGIESLEFRLPLAQNYTSIYGTPPGIAFGDASVIRGNSSNDVFDIYARDGSGNSTLPSNLLIDGGGDADSISINDGSSVPTTYTFFNSATVSNHCFLIWSIREP